MESAQEERPSPTLEDCLKLLSGERDEQRLAGLLLVTKFCRSDDLGALRRIHDAVGTHFLDRLLWTGAGKGDVTGNGGDNRDAYLQLSVTVLAGFCRVPEIAASQDMVSKIPVVLEIISKQEYSSSSSVLEECYEILYLVSSASEDGITTWYETGGLKMLATHMPVFPDGSHQIVLAMKFIELLLSKVSLDVICSGYLLELSLIAVIVARQFSVSHDAVKFEELHLLSAILSSSHSAPLYEALRILPDSDWQGYMRDGIVAILQNRVVPEVKLHALTLAESVISIVGERWLLGQVTMPKMEESIPVDRCLMLVLEQSRVEVSVLLNELAYLKYEASKSSSSTEDAAHLKQRILATPFSLIEKIIKLISVEEEEDIIDENTTMRVIKGLNETIGIVLEYLQDAKEHGQRKGDDLIACVRVVGSYLAETPIACKEKVRELLEYMLSIESEEEDSPFYAVCFLLPLLCQLTLDIEGCKVVVSSGGHQSVINCLVKLIGPNRCRVDNKGCVFLACDTILNLLLKKDQVKFSLDESTILDLLKAIIHWTEGIDEPSVVMMGSCICSLMFDYTSECVLLRHSNFDQRDLKSLSMLISRSMGFCGQDMSSDPEGNLDLLEIIEAGYARWAARFPHVRGVVER